jgi:Amt family ammonium transporter
MGAVSYVIGCKIMKKLGVDDPIEACMVHGFGGIFGTIAAGLFNENHGLLMGAYQGPDITWAIRRRAFGYQMAGLLSVMVWTAFWSILYFKILDKYGRLRVDLIDEILGLDIAEMGEPLPIFV